MVAVHMQCGSLRHRVEAKAMAGFEKFRHAVEVRLTGFEPSTSIDDGEQSTTYVKLIAELMNDARLDSLFLTLPISWKGGLTQYAGLLHRRHAGKREVTIFDYADTNVVMFARMFNKRCAGYKALGYEIVMPLSTAPGLPSNASVLREKKLDETYSESVKRLLRDGVTSEEIDLFAFAAAKQNDVEEKDALCISVTEEDEESARSAVERFLHRHLEALPSTKGLFELNGRLEIPFGANPYMEVDFLSRTAKLAVEVDGSRHFDDRNAYRRDRRKDELLQAEGYFVLRFLAEDVKPVNEKEMRNIYRKADGSLI